jgi:hypothetical protein
MIEYQLGQFVVKLIYLRGENLYHYLLVLDGDTVHDTSKHGGFESRTEMEADIYRQIRNMELES